MENVFLDCLLILKTVETQAEGISLRDTRYFEETHGIESSRTIIDNG
jgi:hypothetical protein